MGLKSVKYIKVDDEKGLLYSGGKQSLLIPVSFIIHLNGIFQELVSQPSAQILIYKVGQSIGEGYAEMLKELLEKEKVKLSAETTLKEAYNAISMTAGWGKIEVKACDLKKGNIVIKISNSLSGQLLKKTQYNLEKGILAGAYKKIAGKEIYYEAAQENKKENSVLLTALKEIPALFKAKEKRALLGRKQLERKVKEYTAQVYKKMEELENFQKLTIGRELKMMELKEEIQKLKSQLQEHGHKIE